MKKILLSLLGMVLGTMAYAQSLDFLTFRMADGSEKSLPVDGMKITFDGAQMHVKASRQTVDFNLVDMNLMFFSAVPTALEEVHDASGKVAIINGRLVVDVPSAKVSVYTMDGRKVSTDVYLQGLYLVIVNGRTYKLMAK